MNDLRHFLTQNRQEKKIVGCFFYDFRRVPRPWDFWSGSGFIFSPNLFLGQEGHVLGSQIEEILRKKCGAPRDRSARHRGK